MSARRHVLRAVAVSLLFTSTYVLNRAVALGGGGLATPGRRCRGFS